MGNDVPRLLRGNARLRRHVTEMPVMLPDPVANSEMKGQVRVVSGPIHGVHQRWSLVGTLGSVAMALGTARPEHLASYLGVRFKIWWRQVQTLTPCFGIIPITACQCC